MVTMSRICNLVYSIAFYALVVVQTLAFTTIAVAEHPSGPPPAQEELQPITLDFQRISLKLRQMDAGRAVIYACVAGGIRLADDCGGRKKLVIQSTDEVTINAWGAIKSGGATIPPQGVASSNQIAIVPKFPFGALLCKTTSQPNWGYCGNGGTQSGIPDGQLQFLVNDGDQRNNSGTFYISVAIDGNLYAGEAGGEKSGTGARVKSIPACIKGIAGSEMSPPAVSQLKPLILDFDKVAQSLREQEVDAEETCGPGSGPLTLKKGDRLSIRGWGRAATIALSSKLTDPNGRSDLSRENMSLDSKIPHGALLCKTSLETDWRYCGRAAHGELEIGGNLQFTINDADQSNNSGTYFVSIAINSELYAAETPPWAGMTDRDWYAQFDRLPDCYCHVSEIPKGINQDGGIWDTESIANTNIQFSKAGHPGAKYDYRWKKNDGKAGQQCTYDKLGNLINAGLGAGTPDIAGPGNLGWNWLNRQHDHYEQDVVPFEKLPVQLYLKRWRANKGKKIPEIGHRFKDEACESNLTTPAGPRRFSHLPL